MTKRIYGVSTGARDIHLPGSALSVRPKRKCDGPCNEDRVQDGGCQMTPNKWVCAECWRNFNQRKKAA